MSLSLLVVVIVMSPTLVYVDSRYLIPKGEGRVGRSPTTNTWIIYRVITIINRLVSAASANQIVRTYRVTLSTRLHHLSVQ